MTLKRNKPNARRTDFVTGEIVGVPTDARKLFDEQIGKGKRNKSVESSHKLYAS